VRQNGHCELRDRSLPVEGGFRRWRALYSRAAAAKERVRSSSPNATHTATPPPRRPSGWCVHARLQRRRKPRTPHPRLHRHASAHVHTQSRIQIPVCMGVCVSLHPYTMLHEEGERVSSEKGCPRSMRAYRYLPRRPLHCTPMRGYACSSAVVRS
jgi:hypothetical protein